MAASHFNDVTWSVKLIIPTHDSGPRDREVLAMRISPSGLTRQNTAAIDLSAFRLVNPAGAGIIDFVC